MHFMCKEKENLILDHNLSHINDFTTDYYIVFFHSHKLTTLLKILTHTSLEDIFFTYFSFQKLNLYYFFPTKS